MKHMSLSISAIILMLALSGCSEKEESQTQAQAQTTIEHPKKEDEVKQKSTTQSEEVSLFEPKSIYATKCIGCHGQKGEGNGVFPKISGQSQDVIAKKLIGYKNGTFGGDKKAMMVPNVKAMSDDELGLIADFVANKL